MEGFVWFCIYVYLSFPSARRWLSLSIAPFLCNGISSIAVISSVGQKVANLVETMERSIGTSVIQNKGLSYTVVL